MAMLCSLGILIILCLNVQLVTCHLSHNKHAHLHHHPRADDNPAWASGTIAIPASATSISDQDAHSIVLDALKVISKHNKARVEQHGSSNHYELQDATTREEEAAQAVPLDWSTSAVPLISANRRRNSLNDSADATSEVYSYSLPSALINAARIVAESSPPGPTQGDPEAIAARIQAKYRSGMNDTNVPLQKLRQPDGLSVEIFAGGQRPLVVNSDDSSSSDLRKRSASSFWMATMRDGLTDDTAAINKAISDGGRCGADCGSSTIYPAVIYFPPGTYLVSSPVIQYYNTEFLGDPLDYPTILAASSFVGLGVITSDVYTGDTSEWYLNTNNFLRSIRNFKMDITRTDPTAYVCAIHWQVAQATSLENIDFYMMQDSTTTQQGVYMENGSGGFMANLTFVGGNFGAYFGNQQFTTSHLAFVNCNTALQVHWDWAWTMQDLIIESCTQGIVIVGGAGGAMSTGQSVGSLVLVDSMIANTPTGIVTSLYKENSTALLLQNFGFFNVERAIIDNVEDKVLMAGGDEVLVDSWGFGMFANSSGAVSTFANGQEIPMMNRTASLLGTTAYNKPNFLTRRRPTYADLGASQVIDVKAAGAAGDGTTDDTAVLNSILDRAANMSSIVFFPHGVYIIKDTLRVPVGSRIVGQAWPQIMATGSKFADETNPHVAVKVGVDGDVGVIEIQDMLITVSGETEGAVLMEWNVHESSPGSAAMWDTHFRVGGSIGSNLQASNCPQDSTSDMCKAASLLLHITSKASAYLENIWAWVADHDMDLSSQDQINVFSARGILIESQGPVWLYGTASEHNVLYQYQLSGAKDVMIGMIQTESPYYQPAPKAPAPFTIGQFPNDPSFDNCTGSSCEVSWALRIVDSSTIYSLGAGLYSWFSDYSQDCLKTEDCQQRVVQIEQSHDIWLFNLITKGVVEMVSPVGETPTYSKDNVNGYMSSILAWARGPGENIGARAFAGFQVYTSDDDILRGLSSSCVTALTQNIACHLWVSTWAEPSYHGSLYNHTLTDSICDPSCGLSLKSWFDGVQTSCAGQNITGAMPTKVGGYMYEGYNETCSTDSTTGEYCNDVIDKFTLVSTYREMPHLELCSDCYISRLKMMQASAYSVYNSDYEEQLEYAQSECGFTGPTDVPESLTLTKLVDTEYCAFNRTYSTVEGDTCDSLALAYSVGSASIFTGNSDIIANCSQLPVGVDLCIPLSCSPLYQLQDNDTCDTIEEQENLSYKGLSKLNPWIESDCSNLQIASEVYGKIVCLGPQGGTYVSNSTKLGGSQTSTGYMPYVISPGVNATVASGTTKNCGKWHIADSGDTCASICVQESITSSLFTKVNPSLVGDDCSSLLVNGTYYCVGPIYEWESLANTTTSG
ncbi:LysM domain protein [Penicillium brasilianum]|uniref:LysM domain protein n=1 Tax=Penicillium brasilianum TaxID=104259 RepID=A0A1S9RR71_PENBI|nr:LysM domain protein [Penicillium brasilianum]